MGLTLEDLKARAKAVKEASLFDKAKAADAMMDDVLNYLHQIERRLVALEGVKQK